MKAISVVAVCVLSFAAQGAFADTARTAVVNAKRVGAPPKVIAKAHQPVGTPHKVSSFAPHHTNRKVYGDPIQPPIMGNSAPRKPVPKW